MNLLLVGSGAMIGATLRFGISNLFKRFVLVTFPLATLTINLIGCFLMGLLLAQLVNDTHWLLLGVGVLGGFTTFSTFMNEAAMLLKSRRVLSLITYVLVSYLGGLVLVWLGMQL